MKKIFCLLLATALSAGSQAATLIHNVHGYTIDDGQRRSFIALEFEDGKITRLHTDAASVLQSEADTRLDGDGATLLPGLIDAHGHVAHHGRLLTSVNLVGVPGEAAAAMKIAQFIEENANAPWILGRGWNQVLWQHKEFPTRESLDALSVDIPIAMVRIDGHAMWVNSKALELAGIGDDTPDPEGGQIIRDAKGKATGVLIDNASRPIHKAMPAVDEQALAAVQRSALEDLARFGLTSVHDARVTAQGIRAYQSLRKADKLPIRVYGMLDVLDPANDDYLAAGPMIDPEHLLDFRSVKISADGALGSRGAALFEDYSDDPGNRGLLLMNEEQLTHHIDRSMTAGYQVNTHAIGDLANARVLTIYEQLIGSSKSAGLRHRVEHAQVLRPDDIKRFAASDIIASIQPTHATSDKNMAGDRLGKKRLKGAYSWQSLLDSGAQLAGGSDFPIESPNPFYGLHAAVTRQSHDGEPLGGWMPDEKMTREAALSLFTEGAAYAAHQEDKLGRLLPGYYADFVLVKDDYFKVPAQNIWKNEVISTYVAGRKVYPAE